MCRQPNKPCMTWLSHYACSMRLNLISLVETGFQSQLHTVIWIKMTKKCFPRVVIDVAVPIIQYAVHPLLHLLFN